MNAFDTMRQALDEARAVNNAADEYANQMATMLVDRLRHVWRADTLRALKKELRDYDMHRGVWKDRR